MTHISPISDETLQEVLQKIEEGTSRPELLSQYPTHAVEIEHVLDSIALFKTAQEMKPSPELLREALRKVPTSIPSPLGSLSWMSFPLYRSMVPLVAVVILVFGGVALVGLHVYSPGTSQQALIPSSTSSNVSDTALANDAAQIDDQLNGLDSDVGQIDGALGS
jgi:hypothetical protein